MWPYAAAFTLHTFAGNTSGSSGWPRQCPAPPRGPEWLGK